ncbi:MAG TPA: aminotransferase class IV [Actinomycetes bacterium]|nr:aminotransferase class IV [Actinomycetes bacterium]
MAELVYLNGAFVPRSEAAISIDDRGFVFADAIYEVVKCYRGRPYRLDDHLARLARGAEVVRLDLDGGVGELASAVERLLRENHLLEVDASLFLQVSRGPGPRNHPFPTSARPTTLVIASPVPPLDPVTYSQGVRAITVPDRRWGMCDVKTVGLLLNVLAKQAALDAGVAEAIFVRDGVVVEGASANFFAVRDDRLITHPEGPQILPGITRQAALENAAAECIPVELRGLKVEELATIDEAFLTGTGTEVLPIVEIDGQPVGSGTRGPVTEVLQRRHFLLTRGAGIEAAGTGSGR